jgi:hypothetical protein
MAIVLSNVLKVEGTETGIAGVIKPRMTAFSTDTHKMIHQYSGGTDIKFISEEDMNIFGATGVQGQNGDTGIQGVTGAVGVQGAQGDTGVVGADFVSGGWTGSVSQMEDPVYVYCSYTLFKDKVVNVFVPGFTGIHTSGIEMAIDSLPSDITPAATIVVSVPGNIAIFNGGTYQDGSMVCFVESANRLNFWPSGTWGEGLTKGVNGGICFGWIV